MRTFTLIAMLALVASNASAQDYVETFTGGVNAGGWTYGNTIEGIDNTGGNPGAFLHNSLMDTFAPQLSTTTASNPFHGDWRAKGVESFGLDLKTFSTNFPYQREVSLMLTDGSCTVYRVGTEFVPQVGAGWDSHEIAVDSASTTMPAGWLTLGSCAAPDVAWNSVITNVTEVRIFYGDPLFFFIFDQWNIGADNMRISAQTGTTTCFGDGSGAACPCGNSGGAGEGCQNSGGTGAKLKAAGGTSVSADSIHFTATQLPANKPTLLFAGDASLGGGLGAPFGDGLRCAGGSLKRLGVQFSDAQGSAAWASGLAPAGAWGAGDTRTFQAWYRDTNTLCGSTFNLSSGVLVQFTN